MVILDQSLRLRGLMSDMRLTLVRIVHGAGALTSSNPVCSSKYIQMNEY